jgi:hypothetical protein
MAEVLLSRLYDKTAFKCDQSNKCVNLKEVSFLQEKPANLLHIRKAFSKCQHQNVYA